MIGDEWLDISIAGDLYVGVKNNPEISESTCSKLSGRDLVCINLEGPICKNRGKLKKIGPNLSQTEESVRVLKQLGCHLVTLANNHIMDYGAEGLTDTMDCLRREGIEFTGAGIGREDTYKSYIYRKERDSGRYYECSGEWIWLFG